MAASFLPEWIYCAFMSFYLTLTYVSRSSTCCSHGSRFLSFGQAKVTDHDLGIICRTIIQKIFWLQTEKTSHWFSSHYPTHYPNIYGVINWNKNNEWFHLLVKIYFFFRPIKCLGPQTSVGSFIWQVFTLLYWKLFWLIWDVSCHTRRNLSKISNNFSFCYT